MLVAQEVAVGHNELDTLAGYISTFFCSAFDTLIREGEHVRGRVALFATCHHVVVDAARKFLHLCRPNAEGQAVWKKSTLNW